MFRVFKIKRRHQSGVVAIFLAGSLVVMLIAMGVAVYTGITAYMQGHLQYLVNSAALAGARSMYDDVQRNGTTPIQSTYLAQEAANAVLSRLLYANTLYSSVKSTATANRDDSVTVKASVDIPTPFLTFINISKLTLNAHAKALYCQVLLPDMKINNQKEPHVAVANLPLPLINGYGPDLSFESTGKIGGAHGVRVQLCTVRSSSLLCYEAGRAARGLTSYGTPLGAVSQSRNGIRYLYGVNFIDMGTIGLHKATVIRFSDDGVHDTVYGFDNDKGSSVGRAIELVPADTIIKNIRLMHYAALCNDGNCTRPSGMVPAPDYSARGAF